MERRALLDRRGRGASRRVGPSPGRPDPRYEADLRELAAAPPLTVLRRLETSPRGLTEAEACERLAEPGGDVPSERVPSAAVRLREALLGPFVLLLGAVAVAFAVVGELRGTWTLTVMIVVGVTMRWRLQVRSDRAVAALRSRVVTTTTVRRRVTAAGPVAEREVVAGDLVCGDVVVLRAGDRVAADLRLLSARDLRVDQSVLSGELLAVPKRAPRECPLPPAGTPTAHAEPGPPAGERAELVDLPSLCFAGTSVVAGTGTGVVVGTGRRTYPAALADAATGAGGPSSVEQGVRRVAWTLIRFMAALVPVVLLVNGAMRGDWSQAALFAVAVAVGLTPEMLPVIATATLARSAVQMSRHRVVVKRLDAIQDLGGMDVVCLDKTGTLTEDRVVFTRSTDPDGRADDAPARYACLLAHFQAAPPDRFDEAVTGHLSTAEALLGDALYTPVEEIPFDHERRRATVVLRDGSGAHLVVSRGEPDAILACCTHARSGAQVVALTGARRAAACESVAADQRHGLRIAAVAIKQRAGRLRDPTEDETGMTFVGFIGFVDPVKESAPTAIAALAEHGVGVRVLSGDGPRVVARVCEQAGIEAGRIVEGREIEAADDATLAELVRTTTAFAKVNPQHKARIVTALQAGGHSVGFLGDGVNDALAMRTADVAVAVHTATATARDAADLILLEADLGVLADGVVEGRRALGNTAKYVTITSASNLGNVLSVLAASVLLPFLPMLPVQLMVQNLLYDLAQLALPWDDVEPHYLRRPRRWDARGLVRFMIVFGTLSSVFDLCTFATLWWVFGLTTPAQQDMFQAGWFTEGLLSQVLVVLVLRSRRLGRPATPVLVVSATVVLAALLMPVSPLAAPLQMAPPPPAALAWLLAIVAAYLSAAYLVRRATAPRRRGVPGAGPPAGTVEDVSR